ncbi:hypothetical protein VTJ83DRAFT_1208 [Remersonia thermophila]|uniref:Cell division protein FtsL n=1 Tax=Remersonia thermophila TaxID=72144 RepID=A0ABR4DNF9_9PEZI
MNRISLPPARQLQLRPVLQRLLAAETSALALRPRHAPTAPIFGAVASRSVSSVAEVDFWKSLVPKPLRDRLGARKAKVQGKQKKDWNPATFFIFIFLLIGSMSIQMIALRRDFSTFTRQADVRIGLLREVVEKLQRGEEVDVERVLGTGDPEKEQLWEQVLRELEREEPVKQPRKKQPKQPEPAPEPAQAAEPAAPLTPPETSPTKAAPAPAPAPAPLQSTLASKGFY